MHGKTTLKMNVEVKTLIFCHIPTGFVLKLVGYEIKSLINHKSKVKELKCRNQVFVLFSSTASMCLYLYHKLLQFLFHVSISWNILLMQDKIIYLNNVSFFSKHKPPPEFSP